jgi:peptide/nickel transport system substrate-binding protein
MTIARRVTVTLALATMLLTGTAAPGAAAPTGQVTWAVHVSLAPSWFDPAEAPGTITPYMFFYALHDAMLKPMPGVALAPSLAESWTVSPDGLVYDFVLRKGTKFHNGEPVTAADVKFSFERYKGTAVKTLKDAVAAVETPDAGRVRFRLKRAWPDFMTFYASATGASWIVPKKYVEQVGDEAFKKAPIGAGPYKFVAFTPGVELVMEAFDGYWRKMPAVKRLVLKVIPDEATRAAALKRGDVDISYVARGPIAEDLQRTKGLTLKPTIIQATWWVYFADQWDSKSPWHDRRVRLAANLAVDRPGISQAETLGFARIASTVIPSTFDFYWKPPDYRFDPAQAKKLLAEAGFPGGLDGGEFHTDASSNLPEHVVNYLQAVGIRVKLRPLERAALLKGYSEKKFKGLVLAGSGAFGNAATRIEAFVAAGGAYVYGTYPDIDGLFREQETLLDRKKREAVLHKIQQLVYDKAMFIPIWENAVLTGVGPRVEESALGLIAGQPWSVPYEDVKLKAK